METIVIAFGGSTLAPNQLRPSYLQDVAETILELAKTYRLKIAIGGGHAARRYIDAARDAQVGEEELDRIGVAATRLNAQLMASMLYAYNGKVNRNIPTSIGEAMSQPEQIVVMGGTTPGHSTDFVAARLAESSQAARLLIVTNVDGVYTADPQKDPSAKRQENLNFEDLLQIIEEKEWSTAGAPGVIDGPATVLISQLGIETCVLEGENMQNLLAAASGNDFDGTRIKGARVNV